VSPRIKSDSPPVPTAKKRQPLFRRSAWVSIFLLISLAIGAQLAWNRTKPQIAHDSHYLLTIDKIHIPPTPPWIRSDIKTQALRDANLVGTLSVLDDGDALSARIKQAFEFQPWVASVNRITRRLPGTLEVDLVYRKPVAAVESSDSRGVMFLPVDEQAVRLPESDLTDAERRYLPRISGITGRPLVGDHWNDPRVIGGARLAAQLADVWQKLRLVEITANLDRATGGERQVYRYEIVTTGGTRILWGMTPGDESAFGESPFDLKRKRLIDYADKQGKLESIDGPAVLDVRSELVVTPRTARHSKEVPKAAQLQTK
jgi:hypothetical protein